MVYSLAVRCGEDEVESNKGRIRKANLDDPGDVARGQS